MPTSYNGWEASPDPDAINIVDFGDSYGLPFPGGVRDGDVKAVLGYVCVQLHERVEPCVAGWDWGYSYRANVNNPSTLSCHSSGTAVDYNAPNHPNGAHGTWTDEQVATIRDILAEVGGAVQWGEDYSGTIDGMHFEIIVDAGYLAEVAASLPGSAPAPEWDEMASKEEIQQVVSDAINAQVPGIVNSVVADVLRAGEFDLEAAALNARINDISASVLRAGEFQLGLAQRQANGV